MSDKALALNNKIEGVNVNKRYQFTENCYFVCTAIEMEFFSDFGMPMSGVAILKGDFELIAGLATDEERHLAIKEMIKLIEKHQNYKEFKMELTSGRCQLRAEFYLS